MTDYKTEYLKLIERIKQERDAQEGMAKNSINNKLMHEHALLVLNGILSTTKEYQKDRTKA